MTAPRTAALLAVLAATVAGAVAPPAPPAPRHAQLPPARLPTPAVSLRVRVPAEAAPGQELTYSITAENVSTADAHHVTVRVPLPADADFVRSDPAPAEKAKAALWKFGTLKPGARQAITLVLKPAGGEAVQLCAYVQFEHGACVRTQLREAALPPPKEVPSGPLALRATGPAEGVLNESLTYRLEVSNPGRAAVRDVIVENQLPRGMTAIGNSKPPHAGDEVMRWELGEIGAGQTRVIEYQAATLKAGTFEVKASARGGGARREAAAKTRVRLPRLEASVSWPAVRAAGRETTYRITVRNPDTVALKGVQVSDDLVREKDDIEFVRATDGGALVGRNVEWDLGELKPGASKSVDVTVKAKRAGSFKNVVTVSETRGVKEQARVVTDFVEAESLLLEVDGDRAALAVGQRAVLSLRAVNAGPAAAKDVRLTVSLPDGLRAFGDKGAALAARTVALPALAEVKAGESQGAKLTVQATRAGPQRLAVELRGAGGAAVKGEVAFEVRAAGK